MSLLAWGQAGMRADGVGQVGSCNNWSGCASGRGNVDLVDNVYASKSHDADVPCPMCRRSPSLLSCAADMTHVIGMRE